MNKFAIFGVLTIGVTGLVGLAPLAAHEAGTEGHAGEHHSDHAPGQTKPHGSAGGEHQHSSLEVPAGYPVPTVSLVAHPDSRRGWNLEMQVTNFKLAPEHVNQADQISGSEMLEGHAHLYLDGVKITRLYGNWYYLESLPAGIHEVSVGLNTNSHAMLMHNGQPIEAKVMIEVAAQ